jgi:hypothetical protein
MMVAKLDIAVSQILDCHDGLFGSIQALHDWCYLQQQLEVPLTAEERGIVYCKSSGFEAAS